MAENNTKITKGVTIKENSLTPKEIEIIPGGTADTKTTVQGSQTVDRTITLPDANDTLVGKATVDTLTNKTIDANGTGNSISNLEVADLAAGVLNVSTTLTGASHLQVPSALAVKTYVDNGLAAQNEASEITYDNTTSGLVATNVQGAIDEVEGRVDTVETGLSNHLADTIDAHDASAISNIPAGNLAATDVQGALNELQSDVDSRADASTVSSHISATSAHGVAGAIVGTTDTQVLTNKTIVVANNTITTAASGNLVATELNNALSELQTDIDTRATSSTLTTHTSASTGVHGVTGAVVGTTDTQTLTNKDIDGGTASNTSRITLPKAAKTTLDALTRKQGTILFDTTSNKPYFDDGTNLKVIGSGSGGATNFLTNPDAETGTTSYATYKDAAQTRPENGTGGTALYTTITTTSTNPLSGTNSFLISKSANNAQGEGVGTDFTIDLASKAKVLKVELDSIVDSGTFVAGSSTTDSDLIVYLYDVTNSRLIEPSSFKFLSNSTTISDRFSATFQTSSDSTSYRLIFHVASTSTAAWALKVDNISVSPSQYVYGTPITDWQSYTPSSSWVGTHTGKWRRVGDSIEINMLNVLTATPSGTFTITAAQLLNGLGLSLDENKMLDSGDRTFSVGVASILDAGSQIYGGVVRYVGTIFTITGGGSGVSAGTLNQNVANTVPFTFVSGDKVSLSISVPILGWSSSVQVSDGYEGRVVAASAYGTPTGTISTSDNVIVWGAASVKLDKTAAYNSSTGLFTVQAAGEYEVIATPRFGFTAAGSKYVNATIIFAGSISETVITTARPPSDAVDIMPTVSAIRSLKAGDTIGIYSNTNATSPTHGIGQMSIKKLPGHPTISATETVSALYTGAPPTGTLSGAWNTVTYGTKVKDSHGAYASGTYTVPVSGQYDISAQVIINMNTVAADISGCALSINNVVTYQNQIRAEATITGAVLFPAINIKSVPLKAGDTIKVVSYASGTSPIYEATGTANFFSITRSGGY